MTTKNSRDLLDWYRAWTVAKYTELGVEQLLPSNMNIPLNNDVRVQAAIDFLAAEHDRLKTFIPPGFPIDAWPAAVAEMESEIDAQIPDDIRATRDNWTADPDRLVPILLKWFNKTVGLQIALARQGVSTT